MSIPVRLIPATPRTELYLSDVHVPYHDPVAWALLKKVLKAKAVEPDLLYIGGDFIDFYPVSKFSKDPSRKQSLQAELDDAMTCLWTLRSLCPDARMFYQEGNHEHRLQRYLWTKAEELSGLRALTVPELLRFAKLEIEWFPQGQIVRIGHLSHIHGNEFSGGSVYPARSVGLKTQASVIMGHYHKIQAFYQRCLDGRVYGVFTNGCLCDLTPEYMMLPQWQQGFTIVRYAKSGAFQVDQVLLFPAPKGTGLACMINGTLYTAGVEATPRNPTTVARRVVRLKEAA